MKHVSMQSIRAKTVLASAARTLALVGIAAVAVLPAHATPQTNVTSVAIADGPFEEIGVFAKTDVNPGRATEYWMAAIATKGDSHLYVVQNTVAPGGSFGWHSHTGPSLVMVKSGTATEYEGNDPTCTPHLHLAGTTFIDAGESTGHLVRNNGDVPLVVVVVRLVPQGAVQRIDLPNPGYCPDIN